MTVKSGSTTIGGSGDKTIASGTTTVYHNSDGTKTGVQFSFNMDFGILWSGSATGNASGSSSLNLTIIPRATSPTISSPSTVMGGSVTVNTPRASTSFTHTLKYAYGTTSGTIATGVATSYEWTIPLSLANQIPNAVSGYGTIYCDTYNGSTLIGTKSVKFTTTVPATVVPTVSLSKSGVDLYQSQYVQGKSKVAITVNASGAYGSSISSRSTNVKSGSNTISSSSSASFTSGVLTYSGTITIATTVTDSRGRTASTSTTISVVAYSSVRVVSFSAYRANSDGTPNPQGAHIKMEGSSLISSVNNTNLKTTILRYREKGTTTWTNATSNTASYNPTLSAVVSADVNKSYEAQIHIFDYYGDSGQLINVSTAFVLMDFHSSGTGMAIGKVAEGNGVLDLAGDFFINGKNYNSSIVYHYEVPQTSMISQTSQVLVQLPYSVGAPGAFLVTVTANANPGGSAGYRSYFVGILTAPGSWNGSIVYVKPTWTEISTHNGMGTLVVGPRAIVSGAYTDIAQYGSQANGALYGLIISGFSTGYPTISARAVAVTVRRLY